MEFVGQGVKPRVFRCHLVPDLWYLAVDAHTLVRLLFFQGCALCSEVPYVEDPYPPTPIANAGIPPPGTACFG